MLAAQSVQSIPALSAILHVRQKSQATISDCLAEVMSWFTLVLEIPTLLSRTPSAPFVLFLVDLLPQLVRDFLAHFLLFVLPLDLQIFELLPDLRFAFGIRGLKFAEQLALAFEILVRFRLEIRLDV